MLSKEVIQEDDPDFAMRDYWSWKKNFAIDGLSIRSRFQNQSGPTQNSAVPLYLLRLLRSLALLPNLLRTITLFDAKRYKKSDSWLFASLNIITRFC